MRSPETDIPLGGCPTHPHYSHFSLPTSAREGENVERRSRQVREARRLPQHGRHFPRPLLAGERLGARASGPRVRCTEWVLSAGASAHHPRQIPIAHLLMRVEGGRGAAPPRRLATGMNPDRDTRSPETEIALGGCPTRPNYSHSSLPTSAREGENVERRSRQVREARHLPQHGRRFPRPLL